MLAGCCQRYGNEWFSCHETAAHSMRRALFSAGCRAQRALRGAASAVQFSSDVHLTTNLAHAGCRKSDPATGAVIPPIYLSSTFERDEDGELSRGFNYSRLGNPTRVLLEQTLAELEGGSEAFAFSSGMQAALSTILAFPNSHVILPDDLYHGVHVILKDIIAKWGGSYEQVDMTKTDLVLQRIRTVSNNSTKRILVWMETPSNPQCKVTDIARIASEASHLTSPERLCTIVDATWSTPYLTRPLTLGADAVLHSMTKYIGGHSDATGGAVVMSSSHAGQSLSAALRTVHQIGGGVCSPADAYTFLRGLRTLHVRMETHCSNALKLATVLQDHPMVEQVIYPGLASHPQHALAHSQMNGKFGGMMSVLIKSAVPESSREALQVLLILSAAIVTVQ